jgi:amino acid adenylation domain-containing protein
MPRSPEMVMTLLCIIKSGAAYLPLDPDYPKDRIDYMLRDSNARLLVADGNMVNKFDTSIPTLAVEEFWDELNAYSVVSPEVEIDGQACAYVLYTSGSTGNPKGVQIEHHSLTNFLLSMQISPGMTIDDRVLAITTISFDIAGLELFLPLITGATLVLADAESARDGRILLEWLRGKQISFLQATPATWRMLLKAGWNKPLPLKALCGGEAMPQDVADSLLAYCQSVWNMYGPTETTVWSTIKKLESEEPMLTVGRPIHNTKIYLLDEEMTLTAPGGIGEIYIGGDGIARGYLNRDQLTNERFFKDPFSDEEGARMYRTGDLGRFLNNGEIVCLGRVDHQVKIRGYRIELGEIEQAIGNIGGVDETVVFCREDVPGEKKLVAYVIVDKGDVEGLPFSPNRDQIVYWKKELQKSLPGYMIPGEWVVMGTFPLTENKKIDRKAFPAPAPGDMETVALQQPVSTVQKMVAEIWCRSLGLASVGLDNDFFELGGHSLTAVEIITELEKSTGKKLPLTTLFKHARLGEFAALFEEDDQRLSDPPGNLANLLAEEIKQSLNTNLREHRSKHNAVSETTLEANGHDPYFFHEEETIGSRAQKEKEVPTTEPQREIWLSCVMGGEQGNRAYVVSHSLTLHGELDYPAMEWALNKLISRHESLRCYLTSDGLNMVIYAEVSPPIHYKDFSYLEKIEQNENLEDYLHAEGDFLFNLNKGPLIRISLLKLASQTHILILTAHHVIMDGWSVGVIVEELAHLYSSRVLAIAQELPIAKAFSDYAEEQRLFLASPPYQENLSYWINQYKSPVPLLDIPTTYPRPKVRNFASNQAKQVVEESLNTSLRGMAAKLNCTFVNMLMTAFEAFLNRLTGQPEIVLGLPTAGQAATGYSNLVGHCVNFLPIRSRVDERLTFQQYLSLRKPEIYASYEHQQLTFGTLLKEIKLPRDASRVPLVPIAFNVDFGINHSVKFHGLDFELASNPKGFQNFEITLNVQVSPEYFVIEWNYNQELFDEATIEGYIQGFNSWLNFLVENSNDPIGSFTLSGDKNTPAMVSKGSFIPNFSSFKPVHRLVDEAASHLPDKAAVLCNARKYTYAELIQTANQLSHYLIDKGVRKGDVVAIVMNRSIDTIVAIIGCLKAGAAYLPIDTDFPTGRVEYMLQDAARMHIVDREYSGLFKSPSTEIIFEDFSLEKDEFSKNTPQVHILPDDAAYVIYTSGSTGKPKGVVLEHGNLFNFLLIVDQDPGISYRDIFLAASSVSFDVSILEVLLPYVNGAQSYMLDKHQRKDPQQILRQITDHRITHMFATPSHWKMLLESKQWNTKIPYFNIISGGEALSKSLADSLLPLCKSLWNIYGPTETTVYSTIKRITDQQEIITIGKPVYNTTIYILDESLQQVAQGEIGELFIAGEGVGRGYLNRPELTAERFIKDPFDDTSEKKMYRTGDLGKYTSDGEIIVIGRKDFQVKIRGHRIELGEIEDAISNLEGIVDVAVITKIDQNENLYLAAYLRLSAAEIHKEGCAVAASPESIKEWNGILQNFLSTYMLPSEYFILDQFPLTTSGKIDQQALAQFETIPYDGVYSTTNPETPEEKLIAEIWENALNIHNTDITRDFFELGGHSMIAVQVMTQLEKRTNIKLPISVLFEYPTIRGLAKYIKEKGGKNPWNSLVSIKSSGSKIPLYIVHGGGMNVMPFYAIAKYLDREQPLYGLQAYGLNGKDEPLTTIEAIAAQYLSEILRQNPDGPYALAGYSLGGLVAFEMAQQLKLQGKEITALVMFDTYAIRSDHSNSLTMKAANLIRREVGKRLFDLELLISNPRLLKRLKKDSLRSKTDRIKNKLHLKENETEIIQIIDKLKKIHINAGNEYKFLNYDGEIHLFRAKIRTSYERDHKYFGWKPYVNKVNVIEMEGEHTTMFEPPNEVNFVKILQRILDGSDIKKA